MSDALDRARDALAVEWAIQDVAVLETFVNAILDAREEKAEPAGDWPRDDKEPRGCPTPGACSAVEALERERVSHERYLAQNDESANAWYARAEKAEAALADLRGALKLLRGNAQAGINHYMGADSTASTVASYIEELVADIDALLSPEGEAKKSAGSHDPAGTAMPGRGSDTVEGVDQNDRGSAPDRRDPRHSQPPRDADPVPAPTDKREAAIQGLVGAADFARKKISHALAFGDRDWRPRIHAPLMRLEQALAAARSAGIPQGASDER